MRGSATDDNGDEEGNLKQSHILLFYYVIMIT